MICRSRNQQNHFFRCNTLYGRIWQNSKFCTISGREACLCDYLLHNCPLHGPFWERSCIIDVLSASRKDYKRRTLFCTFAHKNHMCFHNYHQAGIKLVCLRISALNACHRLRPPTNLTAWHHHLTWNSPYSPMEKRLGKVVSRFNDQVNHVSC